MKKLLIITAMFALMGIAGKAQEAVTIDGFGYQIDDGIVTLVSVPDGIQSLEIPAHIVLEDSIALDVTVVGIELCANRTTLMEVTLPNTIKVIEIGAFWNCTGLRTATLSSTLTEICNDAFSGCSSLEEIILPETLKYLDNTVFKGCAALHEITLPAGLTEMGNECFVNCDQLASIASLNPEPPLVEEVLYPDSYDIQSRDRDDFIDSFRVVSDGSDCVLYVPEGCVEAYANAPGWMWFKTIKEIPTQGIATAVSNTEEPVAYYDLQGMKVASPKPGSVVIRRQGSKSEKIRF